MSKLVPKTEIKAAKGQSEEGEAAPLGPTPEGAHSVRGLALGTLIGALLWGIIGTVVYLLLRTGN